MLAGQDGMIRQQTASMLHQAFQSRFERRIGEIFVQLAQGFVRSLAQASRHRAVLGRRGRDLHPDLNSSNLASPCLKKGNKFLGHLAQLGGYRSVEGRKDQYLVV